MVNLALKKNRMTSLALYLSMFLLVFFFILWRIELQIIIFLFSNLDTISLYRFLLKKFILFYYYFTYITIFLLSLLSRNNVSLGPFLDPFFTFIIICENIAYLSDISLLDLLDCLVRFLFFIFLNVLYNYFNIMFHK